MKRCLSAALALSLLAGPALGQMASSAFQPDTDTTVVTAATTSNTNVTLGCQNAVGSFQLRIYNAATGVAHIRAGGSATTSNMPIPAGAVEVLTLPARTTTLGVILASGSGNVYTTCGVGV